MKFIVIGLFLALAGQAYAHCGSFCPWHCPSVCYLGHTAYPEGTVTNFGGCQTFKCGTDSKWYIHHYCQCLPTRCDRCRSYDDPHQLTWDGNNYDNDERCTYVQTQTLQKLPLSPPFSPLHYAQPWDSEIRYGVASDFKNCYGAWPGGPSCLATTIFKNTGLTTLSIEHDVMSYKILGGGPALPMASLSEVFATPVKHDLDTDAPILIWLVKPASWMTCIKAFGKHLTVLVCPRSLTIWAEVSHRGLLGGLCGSNTGYSPDDWQKSDGFYETWATTAFIKSWRAIPTAQIRQIPECGVPCVGSLCTAAAVDDSASVAKVAAVECVATDEHINDCVIAQESSIYKNTKIKSLQYSEIFDGCLTDMCAAMAAAGDDTKAAIKLQKEMASLALDIIAVEDYATTEMLQQENEPLSK